MTFSQDLKQLALSMDGIYEGQLSRIARIIETYTEKTLNIQNTTVFLKTTVDGQIALGRHKLASLSAEITESIKDSRGVYRGQVFMGYDRKKPLWIVSKEGRRNLRDSDSYKDLWSGIRKIPKYRPRKEEAETTDDPAKTSISIPLKRRRDGNVIGIINFRTSDYLEITDEAKDELSLIAETISFMFGLYRARNISSKHTDLAIEIIENRLQDPLPSLTKPMVFVASSSRADKEVVEAILENLKNYTSRLDFVHWAKMEAPGNIIVQLLQIISKCRYGICYFSEKNEKDQFLDNPNVIFEAGMFHGRTSLLGGAASSWIAIREENSGDLFFDIDQERILWVKRKNDGSLDKSAFEAALNRRIASMVLPERDQEM